MGSFARRTIDIPSIIDYWKALGVDKYVFENPKALTEEELCIRTYIGCTKQNFDRDRDNYKHFNNRIIEEWGIQNKGTPIIMRDYGRPIKNVRGAVTKICKVTPRRMKRSVKRLINISAGTIARAYVLNDKLQLGQPVYQKLMEESIQLISEKDKIPLPAAREIFTEAITAFKVLEEYKKDPEKARKQIAGAVLDVLDMRPALVYEDQRMQEKLKGTEKDCKYTQEANCRRNKQNAK